MPGAAGLMIPDSIAQWRMPDGSVIRLEDWVDKPVWSCADLGSSFSDSVVTLFTYTVGQEVAATQNLTTRRTATERETNVQVGGSNASTEEILIFAIRAEMYLFALTTPNDATSYSVTDFSGAPAMTATLLSRLNEALTLRLMVSQKCYAEEGLGYFNTGFGPSGFTFSAGADALITQSIRTFATAGLPSDEAVRYYRMPHHIGGTEKYRVELRNWRGETMLFLDDLAQQYSGDDAVVHLFVHLEGARKRPTA